MSEISVSVVGSTSINPTVGNGDVVNVSIASSGERGPTGSTGSAGPANTLTIGTVTQGAAAATITGTSPNQVLNLVLQKGDAGPAATNIELQATDTHIQWRYVGGTTWTNLVALSAITGPQGNIGTPVELQATSTHIQWRYVGGSTWTNVVALSSLVGATGATGATGPQGPAGSVNLADETPQPLGTASAGTALTAARADHVHAVGSVTYSSLSGIPSTFAPSAHQHAVSDVTGLQTQLDGKQAAGAYATLVNNLVPSANLPSYVDDVVEYANLAAFTEQSTGKIFVARDTGKIYRWSGSAYVEISPSPGSTDSVTEGSTNLYFTNNRAAAAAPVASVAGRTGTIVLTKSDVGLGNVTNVDSTARANHTGTQLASTISDFATEAAKYGPVTSVSGRTGTVTVAQLGTSGTASSTTFLRGDGAWSAAGSTDASALTSGTVAAARLPLATTSAAGAVIVGSGLAVTVGGVLSWDNPGTPSAPQSVTFSVSSSNPSSNNVSWTAGAGVAAATYEVQQALSGTLPYVGLGTTSSTTFSISAFNRSSADGYRVRAISSSGVVGEWGYTANAPGSSGPYTLPTATDTVLGGVKVGTGLAISSGVLSATGGGSYTLPTATSSVLGGIKVGTGLTITDGVLAATGGSGSANIVEAATAAGFPATGASQTLYISRDSSRVYRYDSSGVYIEIGN